MPATTNSIARAPSNIPKIFCTTIIMVGPTFFERLAESHIAKATKIIIIKIGVKFISISVRSFTFDSAISKAVVIAPGPAIKGIAKGKIARD